MNRKSYKSSRLKKLDTKQQVIKQTRVDTKSQTYKDTLKLIKQANARITKLRQSGYDSGTWSSKKLNTRLQTSKIGAWHRGKIKINENMTNTQLLAVQKATKQFLVSKTSTPKGINKVKKKTLESLSISLSDEDREKLTSEDAEFYYEMLGNNDFDYFNDKLGASTTWILIDEAIEKNDTEEKWLERLGNYITLNDEDVRNKAIRLYNKYISGSDSVSEARGKRYQDFYKNFS